MSLLELGPIAFGSKPVIIAFLHSKHVLASQQQCSCGTMMTLQERPDISDGCRWRCTDCKKAVSIHNGSFFSKSKIALQKWLLLMHWWSRQYSFKRCCGRDKSVRTNCHPSVRLVEGCVQLQAVHSRPTNNAWWTRSSCGH